VDLIAKLFRETVLSERQKDAVISYSDGRSWFKLVRPRGYKPGLPVYVDARTETKLFSAALYLVRCERDLATRAIKRCFRLVPTPDARGGILFTVERTQRFNRSEALFRSHLLNETGYFELHSLEQVSDALKMYRPNSHGCVALMALIPGPIT